MKGRSTEPSIPFQSQTQFIDYCLGKRGRQPHCVKIRCTPDFAEVSIREVGKSGLARHAPIFFPAHGVADFMVGIDLIIKSRCEVVAIGIRILAGGAIRALVTPAPAETGGV